MTITVPNYSVITEKNTKVFNQKSPQHIILDESIIIKTNSLSFNQESELKITVYDSDILNLIANYMTKNQHSLLY